MLSTESHNGVSQYDSFFPFILFLDVLFFMAFYLYLGANKPETVLGWLQSLNMVQYENTFLSNGYDDMKFMVSIMEAIYYTSHGGR